MRAARFHAFGEPLRIEDVPTPEPAGTQVRVRVAGCGICHTDLHVMDGVQTRVSLPITLGHEVAGWVEALGPDAPSRIEVGEPVAVHGGWGCGFCRECRAGAEQRCAASVAPGFQADGGYAEAMLVPHPRHLVPLRTLDPMRAAPLADAGITPYRAVRRAAPWLRPRARVLVIGCGGLGQFALQFLRLVPPAENKLIVGVRDIAEGRLERATQLGADVTLLDAEPGVTLEAMGGAADVVLDFVGTNSTLQHATAAVAPDGLVVLVGEAGGAMSFGFEAGIPLEAWLTTVAWGSHDDLRDVVRLAEEGRLQWEVEPVPLADVAAAHARLRAGDVAGRVVLIP